MKCKHEIKIETKNGNIITYCSKCGKILDSKPIDESVHEYKEGSGSFLGDNGGVVLND